MYNRGVPQAWESLVRLNWIVNLCMESATQKTEVPSVKVKLAVIDIIEESYFKCTFYTITNWHV